MTKRKAGPMSNSLNITIAGAGIGGLSAATALAQTGHSVVVAERAPQIGEVGAGIQISPNGMARNRVSIVISARISSVTV